MSTSHVTCAATPSARRQTTTMTIVVLALLGLLPSVNAKAEDTTPLPDSNAKNEQLQTVPQPILVMPSDAITTLKPLTDSDVMSLSGGDLAKYAADHEFANPIRLQLSLPLREPTAPAPQLAGEASFTQESKSQQATAIAWRDHGAGCNSEYRDGRLVKTIEAAGMVVTVTLMDTGWKYRTDIHIVNQTAERLNIHPSEFRLFKIQNEKSQELKYQDAFRLAKGIENTARRRAAYSAFCNGLSEMGAAMQTTTSTIYGSYGGYTTVTTPDHTARLLARHRTESDNLRQQGQVASAYSTADDLRRVALKSNTLNPGSEITGAVFFERSRGRKGTLVLEAPIGSRAFRFDYDIKQAIANNDSASH